MKKVAFFSVCFTLFLFSCQKDSPNNQGAPVPQGGLTASDRAEDIPCGAGAVCDLVFTFTHNINLAGTISIFPSTCGSPCSLLSTTPLAVLNNNADKVTIPFSCTKCFTLIGNFPNTFPAIVRVDRPDGTFVNLNVRDTGGTCGTLFSPQVQADCLDNGM